MRMALSTRDMVAGGSSPIGVGELDVRRQPRLVDAARDGGSDDGGGVAVARVVLHDEHGPHAPLFAAHHGRKIGIVKFTAFYVHP